MVFTKEQLQTGNFTPDQLNLIKSVWDQPHLEDDPLFVEDPSDPSVRLRAVLISARVADHSINGWLLFKPDGEPSTFSPGQQSLWKKYTVIDN